MKISDRSEMLAIMLVDDYSHKVLFEKAIHSVSPEKQVNNLLLYKSLFSNLKKVRPPKKR